MGYPVFQVPAGDVLPVMFSSYAGATGASVTLTGLAVTDIEIYKDGSVTQRASDAGYVLLDTDGIDFDGITGIHGFSIDTGDNTDAGFYTVGAWFTVVVSAVTVDSQTVNFIACQFRLMPAEAVAGKPKVDVDAWLGTAAATPTVAGVPEVDLTHVAGSTTNVSTLATDVQAIITDTADMQPKIGSPAFGSVASDIANVVGLIGSPSNLGSGASVSANLADIEAQTDDIGVAGAGLTAVPWNAAWDAEVQSEVEDALVVHRLDELLNADSDIDGAAPPTVGSVFHELLTKTAGSFTYDQTTDSLEALRDNTGTAGAGLTAIDLPDQTMNITGNLSGSVGSVTGAVGSVTGTIGGLTAAALKDFFDTDSATTYASAVAGSVVKEIADNAGGSALTAAAIADAVWDEAQADHVAVGSFGITASEIADILVDTAVIGAAGAGLTALATQVSVNTVDTVVDAIKVKTDSLGFTVAGFVDANIQYVNDVAVTGTGALGDEWGP